MIMYEDSVEKVGRIADSVDSLLVAMKMPMPAQFHLAQLKVALVDISTQLKDIYICVSGENPWIIGESPDKLYKVGQAIKTKYVDTSPVQNRQSERYCRYRYRIDYRDFHCCVYGWYVY